jgi:hypothetical protein
LRRVALIEAQTTHRLLGQPAQPNNIVISNGWVATQRPGRSLLSESL